MSDWTPSQTCPGYREKTIQRGDVTIIIRRPVLDEVEQVKREKHVQATLGSVLNDYINRKESRQ
jgi:hypothetical protein